MKPKTFTDIMKIIIIANKMDFGAVVDGKYSLGGLKSDIMNFDKEKLDVNDCEELEEAIFKAKNIMYLVDNDGEIIFDTIFLKHLNKYVPKERLFIVAKSAPMLNDATVHDLEKEGLGKYGCALPLMKSDGLSAYMIADRNAELPIVHTKLKDAYIEELTAACQEAMQELKKTLKEYESIQSKVGIVLNCPCCYESIFNEIRNGQYTTLVSPIPDLILKGLDLAYMPSKLGEESTKDFVQATIENILLKK